MIVFLVHITPKKHKIFFKVVFYHWSPPSVSGIVTVLENALIYAARKISNSFCELVAFSNVRREQKPLELLV